MAAQGFGTVVEKRGNATYDRTPGQVVMSGSLWKERSTWLHKMGNPMGDLYRYRLRFCALSHGHPNGGGPELRLWKDETRYRQMQDPDKTIFLSGCSLGCAAKHTGKSESFGLFHPERKEVFLLCPDRTQYLHWMEALEGTLINPEKLKINDFQIVTMVGKGSFGQVFQVRKKLTNQIFALKVLDKSHMRKFGQVENTKQERRVLEIVNHPFIVKLHYAFQTGPALCLVMDFINGGELFMHLRKHRFFGEPDARIWAAEILLALEYLHSMGIIYRDIKPENVLLDTGGHIKLTDFGLARDSADESTAKEVAGSPFYMAPEVLLMQGHDVEADWWSLGILIYEMIMGLPPFYGKDTKKAYQRLLTEPLEFKDHVSHEARTLIKGLLHPEPHKRLGAGFKDLSNTGKGGTPTKATGVAVEGWGDGMAIKTQAWFRGLRWDAVLLRQVNPSIVPQLTSPMDVSNFDSAFTKDTSWKNSPLLIGKKDNSSAGEDPFANFHYVSRPSKDRKTGESRLDAVAGVSGTRPVGRAPTVRYDVMTSDGRKSVDFLRQSGKGSLGDSTGTGVLRTSIEMEGSRRDSSGLSARGSTSQDGEEDVATAASSKGPCTPWHPCENGHVKKRKKRSGLGLERSDGGSSGGSGVLRNSKEQRNSGDLRGSRDTSRTSKDSGGRNSRDDRISFDEEGHSSEGEEDELGIEHAHHSSHVSSRMMRTYRCNIPIAKEGFILSAKKGVTAATLHNSKKRYVSSKRKYVRLIPSLGCLAVFKLESSLVPSKVLAVPSADKVYPKHGIIHIGSKVHVYSIRVLCDSKEYTFICEKELERDDWVEQLRTVGEHWKNSCMPHLQLCRVVKTWKNRGLFKHFAKLASGFSAEPTDSFEWQAELKNGTAVDMISMLGKDHEGRFRYDGMVVVRGDSSVRHGRGLCHWVMTAQDREKEREKDRSRMRQAYYDGFWEEGSKAGQAMIKFADDSVFEGSCKHPSGIQGYGRMAYANGSWYEGEWHNGKQHGYGYMWWASSNEAHQGEFKNDTPHGHGIRYYPNGEVYQGGWLDGAKHGVGIVESLATLYEDDADQTPTAQDGVKTGACDEAVAGMKLHRSSMRRVTSHAHFQLEVTDDEDDLSHSSHPDDWLAPGDAGDAGGGVSDVATRRAVTRQDSNSSDVALRRAVSRQESSSSIKDLSRRDSHSSHQGRHIVLRRSASVAELSAKMPGSLSFNEDDLARQDHNDNHDSVVTVKITRRCIDGVPLDELAGKSAATFTVSDEGTAGVGVGTMEMVQRKESAMSSDESNLSEAEVDTQAVRRYEDDLAQAQTVYYSDPKATGLDLNESLSPGMEPNRGQGQLGSLPSDSVQNDVEGLGQCDEKQLESGDALHVVTGAVPQAAQRGDQLADDSDCDSEPETAMPSAEPEERVVHQSDAEDEK